MLHTIHIHQLKLKRGEDAIIDRTWRGSHHSRSLDIICVNCGTVAATVLQPEKPDKCGARAFVLAAKTSTEGQIQ